MSTTENAPTPPSLPVSDAEVEHFPRIQGRCPACGGTSLFLGSGGYVTCSRVDCSEPDAATTVLEHPPAAAVRLAQVPDGEREALRDAIGSVYDRHDHQAPLNHVNVEEWVDAVLAHHRPEPTPDEERQPNLDALKAVLDWHVGHEVGNHAAGWVWKCHCSWNSPITKFPGDAHGHHRRHVAALLAGVHLRRVLVKDAETTGGES